MITLPFQLGFAPVWWTNAFQIMLEKDVGNPLFTSIHVIQAIIRGRHEFGVSPSVGQTVGVPCS